VGRENIHPIKLKGPWAIVRRPGDVASTNPVEPETVHLPADWRSLFGSEAGTAVFERRFNRPSGLTNRHQVRVLFAEVSEPVEVRLNGERLAVDRAGADIQAVDVTGRMRSHNLLTVEVHFDPGQNANHPGGLWQPVVLQIEEQEERLA
jgi:hypothetical protein